MVESLKGLKFFLGGQLTWILLPYSFGLVFLPFSIINSRLVLNINSLVARNLAPINWLTSFGRRVKFLWKFLMGGNFWGGKGLGPAGH